MDKEPMGRRTAVALVFIVGALGAAAPAWGSSMVYTANFVTNIKIGDHTYNNASVTIVFKGDTGDIADVKVGGSLVASQECSANGNNGVGYFKYLSKGVATISAKSAGRTITATLAPDQVFVALDSCNGGIGFGSYVTGNLEVAYPVGFTLGTAMSGAVNNDLTIPANMSGSAFSCIGYPPNVIDALPGNNGVCTAPDAYPLYSTNVGKVYIYQPYTTDGYISNHGGSLNRGTFSIAPNTESDD
jgi:hypothetical protein